MEYTCNEELVCKLLQKLTTTNKQLEVDMRKQLETKRALEEVISSYKVSSLDNGLMVSDIYEKGSYFLNAKKLENYAQGTLNNYRYDLTQLAHYINKPVALVSTLDMRNFLSVVCKDLKATSKNTRIARYKAFFGWLVEEEFINKNPMGKIKTTKAPKKLRNALSPKEVVEIKNCETLTIRQRAILSIFLNTGCRLAEIRELNINDIDWKAKSFKVIGKGNKECEVYFNEEASYYLRKYLDDREDNCEALFTSYKKPYHRIGSRTFEREFKVIQSKANISSNLFPHISRHTYSQTLLDHNMDIATVSKLLGHSNISTTQTYCSVGNNTAQYEYKKIYG